MRNLISIIVPIYNKELYLEECVQSIICQEYDKFELILIDDQSTDTSYEICKRLAKNDRRIKCYQMHVNSGPGAVRNYGMSVAQGKYIQFVDADDTISPNMTAKLVSCYELENDIDLVICGYQIKNDFNNKTTVFYEKNDIVNLSQFKNIIITWRTDILVGSPYNKLFRKDIIDRNNIRFPENQNWAEDFMFNLRYVQNCGQIKILSDILYSVRRGIESLTVSYVKCMDLEKAYKERCGVIEEYKKLDWKNADEYNLIPQVVMIRLIRLAAVRKSSIKELCNLMQEIVYGKDSKEFFIGTKSSFLSTNESRIYDILLKERFLLLAIYERVRAVLSTIIKRMIKIS